MAAKVYTIQEEATKAQGELALQIVELQLQAQQPQPDDEHHRVEIQEGMETIRSTVREYSGLLDQSIDLLTSLQDDPIVQHIEAKVCTLQQAYDTYCREAKMVTITQRLAKMREAQVLKAQMDVARKKEAKLKDRIQTWIN